MLDRDLDGKPVKGVRAAEGSLAERPCSTATSRSMAAFRELSHHLSPSATFNFHHLSSLCPFQPGYVRWNGETEKLSVHTSKRVFLRPASHNRSQHNPASWMMFSSDSFICSSTHKMTEFSVLLLHLLLSTPPSHFFAIYCVESSGKTNLSGGGQLASGAVMVGPPGSLLYLARLSPMLGICSALGDLS